MTEQLPSSDDKQMPGRIKQPETPRKITLKLVFFPEKERLRREAEFARLLQQKPRNDSSEKP